MAHKPTAVNTNIKQKKKKSEAKLNITSMMDLMTIILLFLLKSYDAEGNLPTQSDGLTLPKSTVDVKAKQSLDLVVGQNLILVEKEPVAKTEDILKMIAANPGSYMIEALYNDLLPRSENGKQIEADYGTKFKGEVSVQIDEGIPYEVLTRIMYTCGQAGWAAMKLTVFSKS